MELPAWFRTNGESIYEPNPVLAHKKIRLHFLDRTLQSLIGLMEEYIFSEFYSRKPGLLQGLDARLKLMGLSLLIITASLIHSLPFLYTLYGLTLVLAVLSRIKPAFFLKRVWVVLFFFVGIIALPATLNLFTPGETVWILFPIGRSWHFGPYALPSEIGITKPGVFSALLLVGRVSTSLSLVLLLVLTTSWPSLLKALRSLLLPQIYVQTLSMTLRYLVLLSRIVQEMCLAKKSRTLRVGKTGVEQRWVAGQLGTLFKWSMQLSIEVHRAMVARGFQGEVRILSSFRIRKRDYFWVAFCASLSTVLVYYGR